MTAAELDRLVSAEAAYKSAIAEGATDEAAKEAARMASDAKHKEQILRSVGVGA